MIGGLFKKSPKKRGSIFRFKRFYLGWSILISSYFRENYNAYYGKKLKLKILILEVIDMLEVVIFALTLVVAQLVVTVGLMALMFSNWFTKKMMKKSVDMTKTVVEEMEKQDWL